MSKSSDLASDIFDAVNEGTKQWTRTVKAEDRNPAARAYRLSRMTHERGVSLKEAAWKHMEAAYMKASGDDPLPANARQIMYAARPHIQEATGKHLDDSYFTQVLLPNYIEENDVAWDVVYDARGHFIEPNGHSFGIGTLEVREYLDELRDPDITQARFGVSDASVSVLGPSGGFGAVLFIEKEGFHPLIERAQIARKYDLAIMSTKGLSVTAARRLADRMCSKYDVPLLVLHDFDKAGFSILGTLQRDTRRYEFENEIDVVDLGLRLIDVVEMGLVSEFQSIKGSRSAVEDNLRTNGATQHEIDFMFRDFNPQTQAVHRVELNAMTSPEFVDFLERKLRQHAITKVIPDEEFLAEVYVSMEKGRRLAEAVKGFTPEIDENVEAPEDLQQRVWEVLEKQPVTRWDEALARIVRSEPKDLLDDQLAPRATTEAERMRARRAGA
jgi:hypothetical protein